MLMRFVHLLGFVWRSVRKVGAWGKGAFNTVNSLLMGNQLSPFIRNGSSWTVVPIVGTTVCLLERNRERKSVTNRSNIMENGLFDVSMGSRFLVYHLLYNFYVVFRLFFCFFFLARDCCSC